MNVPAMRFLSCLGEISDEFLEEAEALDSAVFVTSRKRVVRYSALATVASIGIAVTYWWLRSKRGGIMAKSA